MSLVKYGLDKFVSALYFKNSAHRLLDLSKLNFKQLLLVAKHFKVEEIYKKEVPEIIVDINELIDYDLNSELRIANQQTIKILQTELKELGSKHCSFYDWQLQFRKKPNQEPETVNTLGIKETEFESYMKIWKKTHLPEAM